MIGSALYIALGALGTAAADYAAQAAAASVQPPIVERFFSTDSRPPERYRALRRFDAQNGKFNAHAWMDVWTEVDERGFRYEIASRGGSSYIQSKVFLPSLETERKMWTPEGSARSAISPENYLFEDLGSGPAGLAWVGVTPKRKDVLLVDGSMFLRPEDGDLVRIQGALSRTPSFWTRRVEITRHYDRIAGVRLPVTMETTASVRIAGTSTFTTRFEYESVNGEPIGSPIPRSH
jgi:hypothetical protein